MVNILITAAGLLNLGLAVITFGKNRHSQNNISFFFLSFSMGLWALFFVPYNTPFIFDSLFWIRLVYLMVVAMVFSMLYFSYAFPYNEKPNLSVLGLFLILNLPIIYMLFFTQLFVVGVEKSRFGVETIIGPFYFYGALIWGSFGLGLSTFNLVKKYFRATGTAKFQLRYMFLGLLIFSLSAMILDGLLPIILNTTAFFSLSAIFSLFFVLLTAYSIIKHRLLDIRVAIQEIVVFSTTTLFISLLFISGAVSYWIFRGEAIKFSAFTVIFSVSAIITIVFEKIAYLSKVFARDILSLSVYDYQKTLKNLSLDLAANLQLNKLVEVLMVNLASIFKLKKIAILSVEDQSKFKFLKETSFENTGNIFSGSDINLILSYMGNSPKILGLDELKTVLDEEKSNMALDQLKKIIQVMEDNGIALLVPLVGENKIMVLILLGDKVSLDPYTAGDINFLNTIAYEASVAFQNAKSYQEISEFNLTLKKEIEKATMQLQKANIRLQNLDQLKDDFVSVASHELRTPMTAIRSYAWMALHRSDIPLSQKMQRYLYRVLVSTDRLINLVNDMLNLSRIEAGRIEISPKPFNLLELIRDIVEDVTPKASEKRLQITVLEHSVPAVFADPDKVREVLLNLIGNSLKFAYPGGLITIDFFSDGKMVEVSVKDNGAGISQEDLARLFHKFSRLENSYTAISTSGGTGLGLYISKNLIELMQGKIWAESEGVDKGSTFTFSLPVATKEMTDNQEKYTIKPKDGMEAKPLEPVAI